MRARFEARGRDSLPEGAAEPKFSLPPVRRATLSNGMQLILVEKHELPMVSLNVVFPAGRADDGQQTPGLAEMTAAVWDEGTATRSAEEIASQLGGMGQAFRSPPIGTQRACGSSRSSGTCRRPWRSLSMSSAPSFPESELHRQQIAVLGRLTQIRNEPTVLASLAATQLLYGYDHPYGHPQWGNPAVVNGFKPADLKRFYETHIRPEDAAVIAVGDIAMEELKQQLETTLGTWKSVSPEPARPDFALPQPKPTRLVLIDKQHAAQSVIDVAWSAPAEHGRFLPADCDEHGFRRAVLQPFEPELAGAEGLHLRRPQRF